MHRHKNQQPPSLKGMKNFPADCDNIPEVNGVSLLVSNLFQNAIEDLNKLDTIEKDFQAGNHKKAEMLLYKNSKVLSQQDDNDKEISFDSDRENHNAFYSKMLHKFQTENEMASKHKDNSKSKQGQNIKHKFVKAQCCTVTSKSGKNSSKPKIKESQLRTINANTDIKLYENKNSITEKKKKRKSSIKKNVKEIDIDDVLKILEPIEEKKAEQNQSQINFEYPLETLASNISPNPVRVSVQSFPSLSKEPVSDAQVHNLLPPVSSQNLQAVKMKKSTKTVIKPDVQSNKIFQFSPLNIREARNNSHIMKAYEEKKEEQSIKIFSRESSHKILQSEYDESRIPAVNVQNAELLPVIPKKTNPNTSEKGSENVSVNNDISPVQNKSKKKRSCFCGIPICF